MRVTKRSVTISLILLICISLSVANWAIIKAEEVESEVSELEEVIGPLEEVIGPSDQPTLAIKIHKIQKEDEIEGWLEGEPDWCYWLRVWNGDEWEYINNKLDQSEDPIIVDKIHLFQVSNIEIQIILWLWDIETVGDADLADISGCVGGGADDWGGGTIPRGAQYYGIYNIKTNSLSGDTTYFEEGYYKTSGDYDGSTATDENDASLWFDIGDNYNAPDAYAGPDQTVMVGEKVNFDASGSTASSGSSIERYQWDFESDGEYDAEGEKTSYMYTKKGRYEVTLTVTDSIKETDADKCIINVVTPTSPIANAGLDQTVKVGEKVDFDGSGSRASSGATIIRYQWDFESDGRFDSEGENTFWTYTQEGTYTVILKVTDNFGQTKTDTCIIIVSGVEPSASFTYPPKELTIRDTVYFYDTSSDPDGTIVSWYWDFGDGYTSTIKDPTHDYPDKGSYTVTLKVTDNDGNSDSITKIITVINLAPAADFTYSPSSPKVGTDIQFSDKSTDPEGKTLKYLWDFGDGFTSTQRNPTHKFTTSGTKNVKLTVIDDEDAEDYIIGIVKIAANIRPEAAFSCSPESQKMNHDVSFNDESTDSDGYIIEWIWNFGDGVTSTKENPAHQFKKGGEYSVRLTVKDDNGDSNDTVKKISIIQTYDLTLEVKDILGLNIANAKIELYANGERYASGSTDEEGKLALSEIAEGNYEIRAKIIGITTSITCSLTQSKTEEIQVVLSIYTISIMGGIIVVVVLLGLYLKRKGKTSLPSEEKKPEEEVVPEEDVSLKLKKMELEKERIHEMLKTFKEKFDKGEIDEETYLRLKDKYEKELKKLE